MRRYIFKDPIHIDWDHPMENIPIHLKSEGYRISAILHSTQGKGPHPTIILVHGFPGYEKNLDLMQIFRRAGFNVITFHYRGSWGSEGDFSFKNALIDLKGVIKYTLEDLEAPSVDKKKLILIGHSMGGFMTLMASLSFRETPYIVSIAGWNLGLVGKKLKTGDDEPSLKALFDDSSSVLKASSQDLMNEAMEMAEDWDLRSIGTDFMPKSILLVTGTKDKVCRRSTHHDQLAQSIREHHGSSLTEMVLEDSHSFPHSRNALAEGILWWLENQGLLEIPQERF